MWCRTDQYAILKFVTNYNLFENVDTKFKNVCKDSLAVSDCMLIASEFILHWAWVSGRNGCETVRDWAHERHCQPAV